MGRRRGDRTRLIRPFSSSRWDWCSASGGALLLSRLMQSLLFGVASSDPFTFAAVAGVLLAVALLACFLPARRVMSIDPQVALRAT
jgi:hypothetical protein